LSETCHCVAQQVSADVTKALLKHWKLLSEEHSITSQKTGTFSSTAVRTLDLTLQYSVHYCV